MTSSAIHAVLKNNTDMCCQKLEHRQYEIWYSTMTPSCSAEKKLDAAIELQTFPYTLAPKAKLTGLISALLSYSTTIIHFLDHPHKHDNFFKHCYELEYLVVYGRASMGSWHDKNLCSPKKWTKIRQNFLGDATP